MIWILVFTLNLASCGSSHISSYTSSNDTIYSAGVTDDIDTLISDYRVSLNSRMNEVIGRCDTVMTKFTPESPLGNFAADVVFESAIDLAPKTIGFQLSTENSFCLLNFGMLRKSLQKGDITVRDIFEFMPFDNTIAIVQMNRVGVDSMLTHLRHQQGQPISNAQMLLFEDELSLSINKVDYTDGKVFVITSNYLASGGDGMKFLANAEMKWDTSVLIRDVYLEFVRKTNQLPIYPIEGRVKLEKE